MCNVIVFIFLNSGSDFTIIHSMYVFIRYICFYITLHWRGVFNVWVSGEPKTLGLYRSNSSRRLKSLSWMNDVISLRSACEPVVVKWLASERKFSRQNLWVREMRQCLACLCVIKIIMLICANNVFV